MNPTFVACHTWVRRQRNDMLTTSATMCKIRSHFLHIWINVVEQVQGGLKGVAQEKKQQFVTIMHLLCQQS